MLLVELWPPGKCKVRGCRLCNAAILRVFGVRQQFLVFFIPTPRDISTREYVGQWRVNGTSTKCRTKLIGPPKLIQKSSEFHEKSKIFETRKFYQNPSSNFSLPITRSEKIPFPHSLHLWKCFAKPKRSLHDDFLESIYLLTSHFVDVPLTVH